MLDYKVRVPTKLPRQKIIWTNDALKALSFVASLLLVLCLISLLCFGLTIKIFADRQNEQATATIAALSTLSRAKTLTAMPTSTPTRTPTMTPTFTPTPVYSWNTTIPDNSHREGGIPNIGYSSSGELFLAYFLEENDDLNILKLTGNSWQPLRSMNQLNKEGIATGIRFSMTVGQKGIPQLAYLTNQKSPIRYAFLTSDGSWSTVTAIDGNLDVYDIKITLDSKGVAHFAYLLKSGELYYRKSNSPINKIETGAKPSTTELASSSYSPITISIDNNDSPYICYHKREALYCANQTGNSWNKKHVTDNGIYPSLGIGRDGNLHLAFYDSEKKTLMYAFSDDGATSWKIHLVDDAANVGIHPSLLVDNSNMVHISYYDFDNKRLKYAFGKNNTWKIFVPDTSQEDTGIYNSITMDTNGNLAIAYLNLSIRRIMVAFGLRQ